MGRNYRYIGENVRRLRKARGWTQAQLATRAHLSSVKMIETSHNIGTVPTLIAIAEALGVGMCELFRRDDDETPQALLDFLASPLGQKTTPDEIEYLRRLELPQRKPTPLSYHLALESLRAADKPRDGRD